MGLDVLVTAVLPVLISDLSRFLFGHTVPLTLAGCRIDFELSQPRRSKKDPSPKIESVGPLSGRPV
jgi:hypothetical protein